MITMTGTNGNTMLRVTGCALVLGAVVLFATPGHARHKTSRHRPFAVRAHVVDFEKSSRATHRGSWARRFDAFETHSIEFDVFQRARAGRARRGTQETTSTATEVRLYLPNGDLYAAVALEPYEGESSSRRRGRHPVATARVPVSGTMITRYGLYGTWRAELCWETGSETSCQGSLAFVIDH